MFLRGALPPGARVVAEKRPTAWPRAKLGAFAALTRQVCCSRKLSGPWTPVSYPPAAPRVLALLVIVSGGLSDVGVIGRRGRPDDHPIFFRDDHHGVSRCGPARVEALVTAKIGRAAHHPEIREVDSPPPPASRSSRSS